MIFGPEMLEKVLSGEKTVTRRRSSSYTVGQVLAVQSGRGKKHVAHIKVLGVREERLGRVLKLGEPPREGFASAGDFASYWAWLHGNFNLSEDVTRIEFELAPSCSACDPTLRGEAK